MPPVEVPVPPSANHLWRTVSRTNRRGVRKTFVTKTPKYKDWLEEAVLLLRCGLSRPQQYPVGVRIVIRGGKGWDARRDLDNATKALIDAVKHSGRIPDDSTEFVTRIELEFVPPTHKNTRAGCTVALVERANGQDQSEAA